MKKIFCFIIVCILACSLGGCKKNPNSTEISDNNSIVSVGNSKQTESSSEKEDISSDTDEKQGTSSETPSQTVSDGSSDLSSSKPTASVSNPPAEPIPTEPSAPQATVTAVLLTAETSRAPSTDIGSIVENGYIYYVNPRSNFPSGLFRKKINGGSEETILNESVRDVKVLAGKIYYLTGPNNLYRCDINGKNIITLDDSGKVDSFEVAGNWVFVTRTIGKSVIDRIRQELYVISTDGSNIRQIKPDVSNDAGSRVVIHGFNRGYCYLTVTYEYFIKGSNISWTLENLRLRIDYRSADLTQCKLKINANYTYNGKPCYDYANFGDHSLYYDHILQSAYPEKIMVSLVKNTAVKVEENVVAVGSRRLRDYYVYESEFNSAKDFKLYFVDFNGNEKLITLDLSEDGTFDSYEFYSSQDIHNNQILVLRSSYKTDVFELLMVSPDGTITEIYSKTP